MSKLHAYYDVIDKAAWPDGPWKDEPDKVQGRDPDTGLPFLIVRADSHGGLCGYVGVPPGHPWHGVCYDDARWANPDAKDEWDYWPSVHGGLTFANSCHPSPNGDPSRGICHVPEPGETDDVWWLGFDCAHGGDLSPAMAALLGDRFVDRGDVYRDIGYVEDQIEVLAKQAQLACTKEDLGEVE